MFCRFLDIVGTECGDQRKSMLGDSVPMGDGMRRRSARGATVGAWPDRRLVVRAVVLGGACRPVGVIRGAAALLIRSRMTNRMRN